MAGIKSLAARLDEQARRIRQGMGYGIGGRSATRRSPTGESEYDRETRLRQEMQAQIRGEYLAGRGEAGRQREEQALIDQKIAIEGWELAYDAEARKKITKNNDSIQKVKANADGRWTPDQQNELIQRLTMDNLGMPKSMSPPDPNKPRAPEGHELGVPFMHEDGGTYVFEVNAQGNVEMKIKQRFDQSPEYKKMVAQSAWQKERGERMFELMTAEVEVKGKEGEPPTKRKKYENWEVQELLNFAGYGPNDAPIQQGAQQPDVPQQGPPQGPPPIPALTQPNVPRELIGWSRQMGVQPGKEEADLPPDVAMAQAFLNELRERKSRGMKLDPNIGQAIIEAKDVMARYDMERNR